MGEAEVRVRIVVAQPGRGAPGGPLGTARVLTRLGQGAEIEIVHDAAQCIGCCDRGDVDLVVCECELGDELARVLEALRPAGPPVVVVGRDAGDEQALDAFRRGAADFVSVQGEYGETLPLVALEQIRRWRAIRERGAVERRILDLQRYNENIIQNMNSALLVVDPEGCITFCNPPAEEILGESAERMRGRSAWEWFRELPREEELLARTLAENARFKGAESTITRADGAVVPIGISCAPLFDAGGGELGAVAIFQDLTEIKQLQRKVLHTEKMASIGQLAAGVAHEINNPMGFIHANLFQMAEYLTDLRHVWERVGELQKTVAQGGMEEVRRASDALAAAAEEADVTFLLSDLAKAIRESQEGSERIRHIVQDLRDFSHQDTAERVLADVNQCLDSTASIVWPMMKHIVVLEKEYRELPNIYCFPMQLKQVFMNLLVNAYQAIEERVGESGETGRIHLQTALRGGSIAVSVSDTGCGVPPENLDRIFDPFFTTKKVGFGTGLGLSTSFSIVQRHGGTIAVESQVGRGSKFEVLLPPGEEP
jgi:PAS domain S-box-containing protein